MTLTELHSMRKNLKAGDKLIYFAGVGFDDPKPKKIIFSDYEKHPVAEYSKNLLVTIDSPAGREYLKELNQQFTAQTTS